MADAALRSGWGVWLPARRIGCVARIRRCAGGVAVDLFPGGRSGLWHGARCHRGLARAAGLRSSRRACRQFPAAPAIGGGARLRRQRVRQQQRPARKLARRHASVAAGELRLVARQPGRLSRRRTTCAIWTSRARATPTGRPRWVARCRSGATSSPWRWRISACIRPRTELDALPSDAPVAYQVNDLRAGYTIALDRFSVTPGMAFSAYRYDATTILGCRRRRPIVTATCCRAR